MPCWPHALTNPPNPAQCRVFHAMPCTHNCNQGRACKCSPLHEDPPTFPILATGFVLGFITAAIALSYFTA